MSSAAKGKIALASLAAIGVWITLIVLLAGGPDRAGGEEGATGEPTSHASPPPATAPETTPQAPTRASPGPSFGRAASPRPGARQTRSPASDTAATDGFSKPEAPVGHAGAGGDGASGAPTEAYSLSSVGRDRIIAAANSFVVNAYGYTGHDREQYEAYVNQSVVPSTFEASPASKTVEEFATRVEASGTKSEVMPKDFRISGATEDGARVLATFDLTDPSGERILSQQMEVVSLGSVWKVASAGELREAQPQ